MSSKIGTLSVGVIALNEEQYLPNLLENILAQDFAKEKTEIVLIDSGSTDSTKQIMHSFADKYRNIYANIQILDNPKRNQPAGWNVFFQNFIGDVAIRIDAHAGLATDFLSSVFSALASGEYVVGGQRPCKAADESDAWQAVLLAAEESLFGSSIAIYRRSDKGKKYVKSLFHGAYRREVVEAISGFDERLVRTEDNDIHYRIRKAGFKICLDPKIKSCQLIRPNLRAMAKQKYNNGYWIGRTLFIQPKCLGAHHFVPGIFVSAIGFFGILAVFRRTKLLKLLIGSYALADLLMSLTAIRGKAKNIKAIALPVIFPILHIGYGMGTIKGIIIGLRRKTNR